MKIVLASDEYYPVHQDIIQILRTLIYGVLPLFRIFIKLKRLLLQALFLLSSLGSALALL